MAAPQPVLALGRVASLHPMAERTGPRAVLVATDLPLRQLRLPVGTGSAVVFRRAGLDDLAATVRAVGQPGRGATDPVLVFSVDAAVADRLDVGDAVWLCA